jgi:hypothetical protein
MARGPTDEEREVYEATLRKEGRVGGARDVSEQFLPVIAGRPLIPIAKKIANQASSGELGRKMGDPSASTVIVDRISERIQRKDSTEKARLDFLEPIEELAPLPKRLPRRGSNRAEPMRSRSRR